MKKFTYKITVTNNETKEEQIIEGESNFVQYNMFNGYDEIPNCFNHVIREPNDTRKGYFFFGDTFEEAPLNFDKHGRPL